MIKPLKTQFASPERSPNPEIIKSRNIFLEKQFFIEALNSFPEIVAILDKNRQMVYCNQPPLSFLGSTPIEKILGKRPGEIFNCVHAHEETGGCGTSSFCKECGAVKAILSAQDGKGSVEECRMTVATEKGNVSLDLRVWAKPILIENQTFTVFTILDIQNEKRREALEKTFFHDILNDATVLIAYAEGVRDGLLKKEENPMNSIYEFTQRLVNQIKEQRDLLAAEKGDLVISLKDFRVYNLLHELVLMYEKHPLARNRKIALNCSAIDITILTDKVLFGRIVGNLIKNALEATEENSTVTVGFRKEGNRSIIFVNNPGVMPEGAQLQMFQRSFSTKGKGRGIGSYSAKLFTEHYLKGHIRFESKMGAGTTFFVEFNS